MCKSEFAVEVDGEQGRLKNLRKENGAIIGTFYSRSSNYKWDVSADKVACLHNKAAKNLQSALNTLNGGNGNGNGH